MNNIIYDNFMDFSIRFDTLPDRERGVIMGFGVFDGVHPGHRLILRNVCEMAAETGAVPAAVTFVPHPRAVLGMEAPELIISVEERLEELRNAGAEATGIIPFTPDFGAMAPEKFLEELLNAPEFTLKGICVGEDWRFGKGGSGDAGMLEEFCRRNGLLFRSVERLRYEGINISSSTVRELAGKGRISEAARILGREVTLSGKVVKGFGVAGKELNAPTANLELSHGLILPDGVFAGEAVTEEGSFPAVFNIGFAPTYEVKKRRIEIHLLNFSGDLYGRKLKVKVLEFLRPERKFSGPEALREQITHDIAQACVIYNKKRQTQEGLQ